MSGAVPCRTQSLRMVNYGSRTLVGFIFSTANTSNRQIINSKLRCFSSIGNVHPPSALIKPKTTTTVAALSSHYTNRSFRCVLCTADRLLAQVTSTLLVFNALPLNQSEMECLFITFAFFF